MEKNPLFFSLSDLLPHAHKNKRNFRCLIDDQDVFFATTVHLVCTDNQLSGNPEFGKTFHNKVAHLVKKDYSGY